MAKEGLVQNKDQMDKYCEEKVTRCACISTCSSRVQGFIGWFETSAKENAGISDATESLVRNILKSQGVRALPICQHATCSRRDAGCQRPG